MHYLKFTLVLLVIIGAFSCAAKKEKEATVGVYYFDGWAGKNRHAEDSAQPWAKNAPTHLSKRMTEEFPGREPIWGWRDDSMDIMEQQIDLAADNGVDFFLYCWYWKDNKGALNEEAIKKDSKHTSLELYLKAKNKKRLKYSLLIANHGGAEIIGNENWADAVRYWAQYFKDPQYVKVDGKPLVVIFGTGDNAINNEQLAKMQAVAKELGFKDGLAIAGCGGGAKEKEGFNYSTHYNVKPRHDGTSQQHTYAELIEANQNAWVGTEQQPYIPIVTVGWDNRPWEGPNGLGQKEGWYYPGGTPQQFKNYLKSSIQWMKENPTLTTRERVVLLYAWNELGEGGYLVPTKSDPEASFLKQIKEAIHEK